MLLEEYGKAMVHWAESFAQHATAPEAQGSISVAKPSLLSKDNSHLTVSQPLQRAAFGMFCWLLHHLAVAVCTD